jgi:hypothetical protein
VTTRREVEIHQTVGRLEGKLDALLDEFRSSREELINKDISLSSRLGKVERRQAWLAGASAVLGAALSFFGHKVTNG